MKNITNRTKYIIFEYRLDTTIMIKLKEKKKISGGCVVSRERQRTITLIFL